MDVALAAANICVGLLSQYAAPFDVAGSLPTPDSISEFFHILGRYFHDTWGSLNFITVAKSLRYSTSKNVVTLKWGQRSLTVVEPSIIRWMVYGFLLVFFSNFVPKMHRF